MEKENKKIRKAILSIILGLAGGFCIFFLLIFLFMAAGLFGWSDGGDARQLEKLETTTNVTFRIAVTIAVIIFGLFIYKMNKPTKEDKPPSQPDIF